MLQAELERHELMLAAVLRGKARFGRHRRNLQAQLAQQNQAVEMLENAMSAVAARVALLAPCARGPSAHGKTEVFGKTEELVFSKTEELSTDAVAPEACAAVHQGSYREYAASRPRSMSPRHRTTAPHPYDCDPEVQLVPYG